MTRLRAQAGALTAWQLTPVLVAWCPQARSGEALQPPGLSLGVMVRSWWGSWAAQSHHEGPACTVLCTSGDRPRPSQAPGGAPHSGSGHLITREDRWLHRRRFCRGWGRCRGGIGGGPPPGQNDSCSSPQTSALVHYTWGAVKLIEKEMAPSLCASCAGQPAGPHLELACSVSPSDVVLGLVTVVLWAAPLSGVYPHLGLLRREGAGVAGSVSLLPSGRGGGFLG